MRIALFFLLIHTGFWANAQEQKNAIQAYAEQITTYETIQHAPFSFFVKDLTNNVIVADVNGKMSIPAASTMKLVTTATALRILGSRHKFKTKIEYSGYIDSVNGILHGDLYIIGGGDPTLGSKYYNKTGEESDFLYQWADTLKALGITEINGRVIGNGSVYRYQGVPTGWVWGDLGNYYGAGPNGLTIYDNLIKLSFKTGAAKTAADLFCTTPYFPNLNIRNDVKAAQSKRDNAYVFGAPYSLDWFVQGSIPMNREEFIVKASNPDPEKCFAIEFDYALNQTGIKTKYAPEAYRNLMSDSSYATVKTTNLYTHYSPSLTSIVNLTNQKSINLFAEHLLCEISRKKSGYGSTYNGALICKSYWSSKINTRALIMTDGSGLSRSNSVSSRFFVELLEFMKDSKSFRNSLAIAGKKGTMASIGRNTSAHGRVIGKSGTMSKMKAYAGYVNSKSGKKLAYAMIINNYNCPTKKVKLYFQKLMIKMAEY